jgi:hypothetical protein
MSKNQVTLLDTTELGLEYSDYVDYCAANEITPEPEESNSYYEWLSEERCHLIEDFLENLRYIKNDSAAVVITGSLGLWNGRKEIYPMFMESDDYQTNNGKGRYMNPAIRKAILKCITGMDDFKVELAQGEIVVHGYHHDGTNIFSIIKLTPRGIGYAQRAKEKGKHIEPKIEWKAKIRGTDLWTEW